MIKDITDKHIDLEVTGCWKCNHNHLILEYFYDTEQTYFYICPVKKENVYFQHFDEDRFLGRRIKTKLNIAGQVQVDHNKRQIEWRKERNEKYNNQSSEKSNN